MRYLLIGFLLFLAMGCSSTLVPIGSAIPVPPDQLLAFKEPPKEGDYGTVVITRDAGLNGGGTKIWVRIDRVDAAGFYPKETATLYLPAGYHVIEYKQAAAFVWKQAEVHIKPGESRRYRLHISMKAGLWLMPSE